MTTSSTLSTEVLDAMRPALRMAFHAWKSGVDLRHTLPRRTFYKYRAELLAHGIEIAQVQQASNVVPLVRVLEAVPAKIPSWAEGTPLFYEPPRARRVA